MNKKKVIFICTHNSCRSQMAEGVLKHLYGDYYQSFSAGIEPGQQVNPYAVKVMREIGVDISNSKSKNINGFLNEGIDIAITVCDNAKDNCPLFSAKKVIHKTFDDLSAYSGQETEILSHFRRVRDEIYEWIKVKFDTSKYF